MGEEKMDVADGTADEPVDAVASVESGGYSSALTPTDRICGASRPSTGARRCRSARQASEDYGKAMSCCRVVGV